MFSSFQCSPSFLWFGQTLDDGVSILDILHPSQERSCQDANWMTLNISFVYIYITYGGRETILSPVSLVQLYKSTNKSLVCHLNKTSFELTHEEVASSGSPSISYEHIVVWQSDMMNYSCIDHKYSRVMMIWTTWRFASSEGCQAELSADGY